MAMTGRAQRRRDLARAARKRVAHRIRAAFALTTWCAAGAVLAATAVAWTVAGAAAVAYAALSQFDAGQAVDSSAATYLGITTVTGAALAGVTTARAVRYSRAERRAAHYRWDRMQPLLDEILAETRAEAEVRAARPPKPALPRPVGMPVTEPGDLR